jgi:hypothetical protein
MSINDSSVIMCKSGFEIAVPAAEPQPQVETAQFGMAGPAAVALTASWEMTQACQSLGWGRVESYIFHYQVVSHTD